MSMQGALPVSLIPGDSVMHRIHPLPKMIWVVLYVVVAFMTQNIFLLYGMAAFALFLAIVSGVIRPMLKAAFIIVPIGSSLLALQLMAPAVEQPWTQIAEFGPITLYEDGLYYGLVLLGRIVACLLMALVVVMTTHPSDLFTTLSKLKVPYTLNFMMAMTLQLIPVFQREVGIILSAQKSRGMKGNGFQAVLPSFVPVFVGAIERVQQLSISLESRGFGSAGHKSSYRQVKGKPTDVILALVGVAGAATLGTMSIMRGGWNVSELLVVEPATAVIVWVVSASLFLSIILFALILSFKQS
ncbi:energy-coupling factor transporter transmembrane component T family protein [Microcella sp.]|uniref:energy-coupling factor transporter transmembrane component T family protein n=1 Tax=Microcella sp. TaxID=1913979 RepID=UPI00256004EE|nr:energy-coupling factor transporter transmembrane component T [Microcella sp.]MBX9471113.1 energy-coupling factor transporter transmembrane protein EcfT [Microcella sp.]